jgi:hypothetical protein
VFFGRKALALKAVPRFYPKRILLPIRNQLGIYNSTA